MKCRFKEQNLPTSSLLPKWLQWLELGQFVDEVANICGSKQHNREWSPRQQSYLCFREWDREKMTWRKDLENVAAD